MIERIQHHHGRAVVVCRNAVTVAVCFFLGGEKLRVPAVRRPEVERAGRTAPLDLHGLVVEVFLRAITSRPGASPLLRMFNTVVVVITGQFIREATVLTSPRSFRSSGYPRSRSAPSAARPVPLTSLSSRSRCRAFSR
ncbi:hypothetical protein Barb4_04383 [Bacteroidales bacterium Barb4]|nr:hypothetical protein Barb4_04383 [Bacteroidales bacterium Barb4]